MKIGITGGIGSGKSYVARMLTQHFGIPVYDCDSRAKSLMTTSPAIRRQLTALVGADAYQPDGQLNRQLLSHYLFSDSLHASCVNAIVHPAVKSDFLAWASRQTAPHVAMESAILLEAGFDDVVDRILSVEAPVELRLQRAMQRDGATGEQVRHRMALQLADNERRDKAHAVILNDGRPLLPQLQELFNSEFINLQTYYHA